MLALAVPMAAVALETHKPFDDYVVDSWDVKQGLPQISVLAMTQDADGYLWFGTQAGLARFDGVRFHRYNPRDTLGVNSNIQALLADRQHRLWIGTALGLLVLEDGRFRRVLPVDAGGQPALAFPVRALAMADGRVLVAGAEGIYTPQGGRLRLLHGRRELQDATTDTHDTLGGCRALLDACGRR